MGASAISVSDTAAHVQATLNTLETYVTQINTITLTDGSTPTITVSYTMFSSDAGVLADISSAYNLAVTSVTGRQFRVRRGQ